MAVNVSYPGVYIEEISSGVHTIVGVATSITAFLGQAAKGPTDAAPTVFSYSDFARQFGDLNVDYPLGYAVRDFFRNGGAQAVIVRLYRSPAATARDAATAAQDAAKAAVGTPREAEAKADAVKAQALADKANAPEDSQDVPAEATKAASDAKAAATAAQAAADKAAQALKAGTGTAADADAAAAAAKTANAAAHAAAELAAPVAWSGFAHVTVDSLILRAASPGSWADTLQARVDHNVSEDVATSFGLQPNDLFNLKFRLGSGPVLETFLNVTVKESPRRVDRVLSAGSSVARVFDPANLGTVVPAANADSSPWTDDTQNVKGDPGGSLASSDYEGDQTRRTGKYLLEDVDLVNLVCVLGNTRGDEASVLQDVYPDILEYCVERRAFLIVDPPGTWTHDVLVSKPADQVTALSLTGPTARNAAVFYPRVLEADPLRGGQVDVFPACGVIAGTMARTDGERGVWKAAAGIDAAVAGTVGLADNLTDRENGTLNQVGINVLRTFPVFGRVVWGSRTLRGADQATDEYKYIPVRRTALFLEESLYRGLKWVVFEPNDEPLWAQIRLNVGSFLDSLFRQGAFQGTTPAQAYFVKCDKDTTTADDINKGIVNVVVGFAPLRPAEFVIVQLQQMTGQAD